MLISQRPTLSEDVLADNRSRFTIEPLEPGFGYTLGNSLRRTLLSSIPGAAVTSIKLEGTQHEFSTIEGVVEDVTEIILNLKGLVLSSEEDEPVVMYLRKAGAGAVTAADIAPPAGVEIHNPELHIATLNASGKIDMELVVERGRGYVSAQQNKSGDAEIGRIPVDSIYSPVLKVSYRVDATRAGERTDIAPQVTETMRRARSAFKLPLALGFGLREPSQLEALPQDAQPDAVVFGSALLKHIDAGNSAAEFLAAHSGTVLICGWNDSFGNQVLIDDGAGLSTRYAHMTATAVSPGAVVTAGQVIGYVGSTGDSTGNHLHFEVSVGGTLADPLEYVLPQ